MSDLESFFLVDAWLGHLEALLGSMMSIRERSVKRGAHLCRVQDLLNVAQCDVVFAFAFEGECFFRGLSSSLVDFIARRFLGLTRSTGINALGRAPLIKFVDTHRVCLEEVARLLPACSEVIQHWEVAGVFRFALTHERIVLEEELFLRCGH